LDRWDRHYQRGRRHVHSPDWEYASKLQRSETITWSSRQAPVHLVRRDVDELTDDRRPTLAQGDAPAGSDTPHAEQGQGSNTARRSPACLDVDTGRLIGGPRAHCDRDTLLKF
jgi:transposase